MGKQNQTHILSRLAGKKVFFQGKFGYGERERLQAMAEAQQGTVVAALNASVDYLVLADLSAGKTVQKQALSLNAKGAGIQVVEAGAFRNTLTPTDAELLALIRSGKDGAPIMAQALGGDHLVLTPVGVGGGMTVSKGPGVAAFVGEEFDQADLTGFDFDRIGFDQCRFAGSTLTEAKFNAATNSDFSQCQGTAPEFQDAAGSRFVKAILTGPQISHFPGADFSGAALELATFTPNHRAYFGPRQSPQAFAGCIFVKTVLRSAKFHHCSLNAPDFDGADLKGAAFLACSLQQPSFRHASLENASLVACQLPGADFTGADLRGANFADADLSNARFDNADLAGCNLRGATLTGVDLAKARNYSPDVATCGAAGPALAELDKLAKQARRIQIHFQIVTGGQSEEVGVNTAHLQYGWGLRLPASIGRQPRKVQGFSDAMLQLANVTGAAKVRYETVDISSTKSPKGGKELRDLVLQGIAEAFAQPLPPAEELAAATKAWRDQTREKQTVSREERERAVKPAAAQKAAEKKKIEKKIEKQVGKVTDTATFLKALALRIEQPKIDKATKMLKASGFQLFNDVTDTHLNGVVKSQTDPDLVYACRIQSDGHYACCTQNLNICGGLRGSICKHLLVLIIGLVQAGQLEPTTIDEWVAKTHNTKPELDKETMGEIFIRYKGAEAGEVDWRPTQTVPEDYYAL